MTLTSVYTKTRTPSVVEDHLHEGWTFDRLLSEGIPQTVVDALKCVTKTHEDEEYTAFIHRAAANPIAKKVKIADLEDNMNMLRFKSLSDKDLERLKKYHLHWNMLLK